MSRATHFPVALASLSVLALAACSSAPMVRTDFFTLPLDGTWRCVDPKVALAATDPSADSDVAAAASAAELTPGSVVAELQNQLAFCARGGSEVEELWFPKVGALPDPTNQNSQSAYSEISTPVGPAKVQVYGKDSVVQAWAIVETSHGPAYVKLLSRGTGTPTDLGVLLKETVAPGGS